MFWCVLKIAEFTGCPTPAQGGWEEEHKIDEQWSPVGLCTVTSSTWELLPLGALLLFTTTISKEFCFPCVFKSVLIQPSQRVFVVPKFHPFRPP